MTKSSYSPTLLRLALLTAIATFPLIFMGGLVTSHNAGMSVPDWPNSYGYNMFTFPPSEWVGGIFYEHTHRLMGTVVGMCSIVLTIAAWKLERRRWARWLATSVLAAVVFQGVLGGLRVIWVNLDLAIVHACFAQLFFCLATLCAIVSSRWWIEVAPKRTVQPSRTVIILSAACALAVFAQLVLGAVMRHEKAGLAIPDFPLAYGQLIPPSDIARVNQIRAWQLNLDPVTPWQVWLHFAHRVGALVVSSLVLALVATIAGKNLLRSLLKPAIVLLVLLVAQLTLGALTVLWRKPADIASAHVAVGALVLVSSFIIAVRSMRLGYGQPMTKTRTVKIPHPPELELVPA